MFVRWWWVGNLYNAYDAFINKLNRLYTFNTDYLNENSKGNLFILNFLLGIKFSATWPLSRNNMLIYVVSYISFVYANQ